MSCTLCRFDGGPGLPGPSDHEPWCPCFMRGPVELENQLTLEEDEMTGKEKSAVCNTVAQGIARMPGWTQEQREQAAIVLGDELEKLLGAGYGADQMLTRVDVARMSGRA